MYVYVRESVWLKRMTVRKIKLICFAITIASSNNVHGKKNQFNFPYCPTFLIPSDFFITLPKNTNMHTHIHTHTHIYIYIYIIIIMSRCQHRSPWPSLATRLYPPSLPGGLQCYILYLHRAVVYRSELVLLPLLVHVKGSMWVRR